jgi:hypothetical protein
VRHRRDFASRESRIYRIKVVDHLVVKVIHDPIWIWCPALHFCFEISRGCFLCQGTIPAVRDRVGHHVQTTAWFKPQWTLHYHSQS